MGNETQKTIFNWYHFKTLRLGIKYADACFSTFNFPLGVGGRVYLVYISHTCKKNHCTTTLVFFFYCFRRCGDIVGETFLTSVDSPNFMIVTMDTKFAGHKASHKGFKLHFEKEKEGMHKTGFAEEF